MADEIKSPFVEPPHHVPAEPRTPFRQPTEHNPSGVIGDTPDEVHTEFFGLPVHIPAEAYTLFTGGGFHVPAGPVDLVGDKVKHNPTLVIGDEPHEIQPAPALQPSPPPFDPGPGSANPPGHVPATALQPIAPIVNSPPPAVPRDPGPNGTNPPPAAPFDPGIASGPYVPPPLDYNQIINRIKLTDNFLGLFLSKIGIDDPFSVIGGAPGSHALDPSLYGKYLVNLGISLGREGLLKFIAEQTVLYSMNAETSKFFDPSYFVQRAPILNGITRLSLDTETHSDIANLKEPALLASMEQAMTVLDRVGLPTVQQPVEDIRELNVNYSENKYDENAMFTIGGLVDAALLDVKNSDAVAGSQLLENDPTTGRFRVPKTSLFEESRVKLGLQVPKTQFTARAAGGRPSPTRGSSAALARSSYAAGIVPAGFKQDGIDSIVRTRGDGDPSDVIDDDDSYVPLSFTDLRKKGDESRTVYFRPFITSLNESLAPTWNDSSGFFGRIDPVMRYQNTIRTISLGFELHAFSPEDLKIIYQKLHWLSSMVYPEIDADLLFRSGPVCRMRVGDIIASAGRGQSGVITSLDFDYTDSLWELKKGSKVARSVAVSLSFTALHDGSLAVLDGKFGVMKLSEREQATENDRLADRARKAATGQTVLVGKFRGFGDPEEF